MLFNILGLLHPNEQIYKSESEIRNLLDRKKVSRGEKEQNIRGDDALEKVALMN